MRIPVNVVKTGNEEEVPEGGHSAMDDRDRQEEEENTKAGDRDRSSDNSGAGYMKDDLSCEETVKDYKDMYVRLLADFENYKRQTRAERERISSIGKEAVMDDLFPVIEHMERAISASRESGDQGALLKGLEMVHRELLNVLEKHGVERVPAVGEQFDPAVHEAVSAIPHPEASEGTVIEEVRAGFKKGDKLLRPAAVVVAR